MTHIVIRNEKDVDRQIGAIEASAARAIGVVLRNKRNPLSLLWQFKFELIGRHPVDDRALI